jgi:DNA-dependent RNA polymerase auxiliary subunit epsilon
MGAGILPTAIYKKKLYFLFGKENCYEKTAPGYSDFGGGTETGESFLSTAIREGTEELTGFIGNKTEVRKMLQRGTYNIDFIQKEKKHSTYRMHLFYYPYNEFLPFYYNNNQRFLQNNLSAEIIKNTRIFEKAEIKWVCVDELDAIREQFRPFFRELIDDLIREKVRITQFIQKQTRHKTRKQK